jgi:hypothetical protein
MTYSPCSKYSVIPAVRAAGVTAGLWATSSRGYSRGATDTRTAGSLVRWRWPRDWNTEEEPGWGASTGFFFCCLPR